MSVNTGHPKTDGGDSPSAEGGGTADAAEDGDWESVPAASEDGTVQVQWSDLHAMRGRIGDLDDEVSDLQTEVRRLEAEMESMRRQHEAAIDRYERLLEQRSAETSEDDARDDSGVLARIRRWLFG
jgi:predicted RNase H-like nuclease (RuvC/YqgF family)